MLLIRLRGNECLFHLLYHRLERLGVIHREIGKHFTIQVDASLLQFADELGVGQAMLPCAGVDSLNPDRAELSFLLLTVAIGVNQTLFNSVFRYGPDVFFTTKEPFGQFQDAFALSPGGYVVD